ncbi:Forkhead box protein M1, partial [Ophiophagus hannah]
MAMIQFAINSTEKKRMMLKDIYTWIEDNFPYFKHVAKPGWKILCSSEDPVLLPPPSSIKEEHYCGEESSSLTLRHPLEEGSCTDSGKPSAGVLSDIFHAQEWISSLVPGWPVKEEPAGAGKEQTLCVRASPIKQKRQVTGLRSSPQSKRQELGRSRRKQHLALSSSEEPVLLLPLGGGSTSFPMGHCPSTQEKTLGTLICGPEEEPPVTCRLPTASTPNKIPINTSSPPSPTDPWRLTPLVNERSKVDFSSPRSSPLPFLSFQDNLDLEFNEIPLRQSLGDSPQGPLLKADTGEIVSELLNTSSPSSKVACEFAGDNSLLEDLALDNMPENWSKLSLDISFPDTGNDNLETDLSWSQLLPQLK